MATEKTIALCNIPELTNTYNNVINFKSLNNQINYFTSKRVTTTSGKISIDNQREVLFVNKTLYELKNVNYLYLVDDYNKYIFYFITNKSYKTSTTSMLEIECDVFQTYQFDFEFLDSFVDRCHVDRWRENGFPVSKQFVDEGLEYGEYIIAETEKMYKLTPNYIITSTNPLGTLGDNIPPITDDELEQTTPDIGVNPDNPEIELPKPEEPEEPEGPKEPEPGENDGNIMPPGITGFPNDISGLIRSSYAVSGSSMENYRFVSQILPTTSGKIIASENTIANTWTDILKLSSHYSRGMLITSKSETDVYNPILYSTTGYSTSTMKFSPVKVMEIGTGKPSKNYSTIYNDIEYGNYIIFSYKTNSQYTQYYIVGFLESLPQLNVGDEVRGPIKLGKVGDLTKIYNSGDPSKPYKGCYYKSTDRNSVYNYIDPQLQGKMEFGKNSGPTNIDLSEYTKTICSELGEYYIPIKNGTVIFKNENVSSLKDLTPISSNVIAPVDCKVLFCGVVDYQFRGPKIYPMMDNYLYPRYISTNYMVLEVNPKTRILIDNFQIPTISTGDVVKQGQSIAINYKYNMSRTGVSAESYKGIGITVVIKNGDLWEAKDMIPEYPSTSYSNTVPQWSPVPTKKILQNEIQLLNNYREELMESTETIKRIKIIDEIKKEKGH